MATANNEKHLRCPMCEALVMIVYRGEEWPDEDECGDCGTELRFDPAEVASCSMVLRFLVRYYIVGDPHFYEFEAEKNVEVVFRDSGATHSKEP